MADVITGLTEVDVTIEEIVAAQVQEVLTANVVIPGSILDYSSMVRPGMDVLRIPRMSNFVVEDKLANTAVNAQSNTFASDNLTMNRHKVVQFMIEDIADVQAKVNVSQAYIEQAARDIAANMDGAIIDDMEAGVSAAAPDHRRAYAGATLAKADILTARQLLNEARVPLADRSMLISPAQEASLLAISEFVRIDESGASAALRNGEIGKLFGFSVLMSSQAADARSLFYHKSAHVFARQLLPRVEQQRELAHLATRWSVDHIYGSQVMDSGRRIVLMGSAA